MTVAVDSLGEETGRLPRLVARLAAHKGAGSVLDQAVFSATNFATVVIIGRLCSPEELGLYALALTLAQVVRGVQAGLVHAPYLVYANRRTGPALASYAGSTLVHHLGLTALGVGALAGLAVVLGLAPGSAALGSLLAVLAGALPLLMLREYVRQLSLAHLEVGAVLAVDAVVAALQLGGLLLLGRAGLLTVGTAYATIAAACAVACLGWFLAARRPLRVVPAEVVADWRFNWSFGRWAVAGFLVGCTTPYLVPWVVAGTHGGAATGILAACVSLANLAGTYVTGVTNVLAPRAVDALARGGAGGLGRVLRQTAVRFVATLGGFCLLVLAAGDLPATLVFGDGYAGTGPVLMLLSLAVLVDALGITAGSGLSALERPGANFAAAVATLATEVVLMFCLVVPLGVPGAALALLGGNVAGAAVRAGFLARAMRARARQPGGRP